MQEENLSKIIVLINYMIYNIQYLFTNIFKNKVRI